MYSIYNNFNINDSNNNSIRYNRDHVYTDEDFERIRKSGDTIKINNTIFANGPSCLGVTQLKQHEYQQYLQYLDKINKKSSEKEIKEKKEKEKKPKKEVNVKKEIKEKKEIKNVKETKEKTLKLNNKKLKLSDVEKLIKAGATIHISV
jgi:IMP dehydrogenase/GMP reductase